MISRSWAIGRRLAALLCVLVASPAASNDQEEQRLKDELARDERTLGAEDPRVVGDRLGALGYFYFKRGNYAAAEAIYARQVETMEKYVADSFRFAFALNSLATIHRVQGRYAEAERGYKRALAIFDEKNRPGLYYESLVDALEGLGGVFMAQGRLDEAEAVLKRGVQLGEGRLDNKRYPTSLFNLALLQDAKGDTAQAEELLKRALAITETLHGADDPELAPILDSLARGYAERDRHDEALVTVRRALAISEKARGPSHPDVARRLTTLGQILLGNRRVTTLGTIVVDTKSAEQALSVLERALVIQRSALGEEHPEYAFIHRLMAEASWALNRFDEGERHLKAATWAYARRASRYSDVGARSEQRRYRSHYLEYFTAVASLRKLGIDSPAWVQSAFEAVQLIRVTSTAASVAQVAARFAAGNEELAALIRAHQESSGRVEALDQRLTAQLAMPRDAREVETTGLRRELEDGRRRLGGLASELARRFPRYAELVNPAPLSATDVQKLLRADEALLVWIFGTESYLIVVRADRASLVELPLPRKYLERLVASLRDSLDADCPETPPAGPPDCPKAFPAYDSHELYKGLIAPAEKSLEGVTHIFAVPEGALESLPLSVLITERKDGDPYRLRRPQEFRDAPWLIRRWAVSTLPSVSSLRELRVLVGRSGATRPFLGIGDPVLSKHPSSESSRSARADIQTVFRSGQPDIGAIRALPSLPETALELSAMAMALGAGDDALILRRDATKPKVIAQPFSSYRVIAFATHGAIAGEIPELTEPALILTPPDEPSAQDDGLLRASDIARLKLDASWVILSACNTAAADGTPGGDGLSGLARAFFYAGARSLFVSHWAVASDPAVALTTNTLAFSAKLGRAEAHRQAMLAYLGNPMFARWRHPAYWAPFVVVGDGGLADSR